MVEYQPPGGLCDDRDRCGMRNPPRVRRERRLRGHRCDRWDRGLRYSGVEEE